MPILRVPAWSYLLFGGSWLLCALAGYLIPAVSLRLHKIALAVSSLTYFYVLFLCAINGFDRHLAALSLVAFIAIAVQLALYGYVWVGLLCIGAAFSIGACALLVPAPDVNFALFGLCQLVSTVFAVVYALDWKVTLDRMESTLWTVQDIIDGSENAIILLSIDCKNINYVNKHAQKLVYSLFKTTELQLEMLPVLLGKSAQEVTEGVAGLPFGVQARHEHVLAPISPAAPLFVQILTSRMRHTESDWLMVRIMDISRLQQLEQRLQEKSAELDVLVYKASHDLKSPIASILGLVNVIRDTQKGHAEGGSQKEENKYVSLIEQSALRLDTIMNNLAAATTVRQGELVRNPISLEILVKTLIENIQNMPTGKMVAFTQDIRQEGPLYVDRHLLSLIVGHLLQNAATFRRQGVAHSVHVEAYQQEDRLAILVKDNGAGIPREIIGQVFDMFMKGSNSATGTGLGLYIVKNAIEKLQGVYELKSTEGEGTTFFLWLPV